jgi:hypothetical protein
MTTTYASYMQIANNLDRYTTMTEKTTDVASATKYYQDNIGKIKSIDDFMKDDRIFRYAMKAYGLEDMTYAKAMVKKALTEGVTDSKSFANTLTDKRFAALAKAFDFKTYGDTTTQQASATTGTVSAYVRQAVEVNAGEQNEGVQLALEFARKAPTITSAYGILADKDLLKVVQTTLGISEYTSYQDIDKQATMISKMMDISSLQDPAEVQKFLTKFTAKYDMANSTAATDSSNILFATPGSSGSVSIGSDILSAIQSLKLGG